jgi:hypothetical protein
MRGLRYLFPRMVGVGVNPGFGVLRHSHGLLSGPYVGRRRSRYCPLLRGGDLVPAHLLWCKMLSILSEQYVVEIKHIAVDGRSSECIIINSEKVISGCSPPRRRDNRAARAECRIQEENILDPWNK